MCYSANKRRRARQLFKDLKMSKICQPQSFFAWLITTTKATATATTRSMPVITPCACWAAGRTHEAHCRQQRAPFATPLVQQPLPRRVSPPGGGAIARTSCARSRSPHQSQLTIAATAAATAAQWACGYGQYFNRHLHGAVTRKCEADCEIRVSAKIRASELVYLWHRVIDFHSAFHCKLLCIVVFYL